MSHTCISCSHHGSGLEWKEEPATSTALEKRRKDLDELCVRDWLRREVARALPARANVIPLLMPGFAWPESPLPDDIGNFPKQNGVNFSLEHPRDSFDKPVRLLRSAPQGFLARTFNSLFGRSEPTETAPVEVDELDRFFKQALEHWDRLEMFEARQILLRLRDDYANYRHTGWDCSPAQILTQALPDRRRSILVVTGGCPHAQLNDLPQAIWLKREIERRGDAEKLETAHVITDTVLHEAPLYRKLPQIAIGGPNANSLTAEFKDQLKTDTLVSNRGALIQHDLEACPRQVALWGTLHEDTSAATFRIVQTAGPILGNAMEVMEGKIRHLVGAPNNHKNLCDAKPAIPGHNRSLT